jgi:hypothetical protein
MRLTTLLCRITGLCATPQHQENTLKSFYLASLTCSALLLACSSAYSEDADKGEANRDTSMHRDFDTVDTNHRGYVTPEDVKDDGWVSRNFVKCNVRKDGRMSRDEYAACHE